MKHVQHVLVCLTLLCSAGGGFAQQAWPQELVIGTKEAAPFAMKNPDGTWQGISIDLWRDIANELHLEYRLQEMELNDLLAGVQTRHLDAAVAALTITAKREKQLDFTHPFYTTGLGIAVSRSPSGGWLVKLKSLFSFGLIKIVLGLAALLFLVGVLVWLFERKKNPQQFGDGTLNGLLSGFWWSAVTMTTVGYGDKAPVTAAGRLIGLVWMFAGIIMISSFTAAITSALTLSQLETTIHGPDDLANVRVGAVSASTSTAYLEGRGIPFHAYPTATACLQAIVDKQVDAVVYDEPILRYLSNTVFNGRVEVLPASFHPQYYGIALPQNSPLREAVNQVLLSEISSPAWKETLLRYLGKTP